ncbi:MAG TPA: zf-HC2 domain-containing protein [Luteibacter sp.]|uniref:zf-HC2 domain-containing protein n=1 Tax=Luteibacter sp. TaxID=1886636 RepID=UPI002CC587E0|nr:zf-HC2 domain-containing protein [Luteibacter sp.]HVI56743.1 zf-HC2 domain-containing protein [Luteibacter sp.]
MRMPTDTGRDCGRAWEAMPWVLQDSAPQEQTEWLMGHLAECDSCRAEFEQQKRLRLAMSLPADVSIDPELGLRRLLARVDAPEIVTPPARAAGGSWVTRALVAAVLIQAIGLGTLGAKFWAEGTPQPAYHTLSQPSAHVPAGAIHVVPDTGMKLADWNALLQSMQLQVIGGPNDVGAYTVLPEGGAAASPQLVQRLRAAPGVRLAEPVNANP